MGIRTSLARNSATPLALSAATADRNEAVAEAANRGGTTTTVLAQAPPLSAERQRAAINLLIPVFATSLPRSQTIASGYAAYMFWTLTIPAGVTLTIDSGGFMGITSFIYV